MIGQRTVTQTRFVPFPSSLLPQGFRYPEAYLTLSRGFIAPRYFRWWFISADAEASALDWDYRLHWQSQGWRHLDQIDPIPFARDGDWSAYFDGNDRSGDPHIVVSDLGNRANGYTMPDFDSWRRRAFTYFGPP